MGNPRPRESSLVVYQQNVRGLGEAKIEELVWQMKRLNVYAWTLQETWRSGREILRNGDLNTDAGDDDFIILTNGLDSPVCHRGSQGVALVLGPEAKRAWEASGCVVEYFGTRVIAARLPRHQG